MSEVRAVVREIDGQLVLDDPDALAVMRAVEKVNCRNTFRMNVDRVQHFIKRMRERGDSPDAMVIVVLNVDDPHGGHMAELLMPGHEWQAYRDRGEVPFARGLAERAAIQDILGMFDKEAAAKLQEAAGRICVVVVDYGVAEVFDLPPSAPERMVQETP